MGNCVGVRNYKYFIGFVNFTALLICYHIAMALVNLDKLAEVARIAQENGVPVNVKPSIIFISFIDIRVHFLGKSHAQITI